MSIPTGDTLFLISLSHRCFLSSKLIHLVDCRKVEEEGIIQHRHLHPDTFVVNDISEGIAHCRLVCESMCEGVYSFVELMGTGELAFMEQFGGVYTCMYHACVRDNNKRSSDPI